MPTHWLISMPEMLQLLSQTPCPGGYTHLRIAAPNIAQQAQPGQHVKWGQQTLQIMRANPAAGWIELLSNTTIPSDDTVDGPHGEALQWDASKACSLLIAQLATLPSLIFLAEKLSKCANHTTLVLLQADHPLPFRPAPCRTLIPGMPAEAIATLPLLNDWGIAVRIASRQGLPGCFDGDVEQLAAQWLAAQSNVDGIGVIRLL